MGETRMWDTGRSGRETMAGERRRPATGRKRQQWTEIWMPSRSGEQKRAVVFVPV